MITDMEYRAHDHEHESFGDLTKTSEKPGKLSAAAATALKKTKKRSSTPSPRPPTTSLTS